MTNLTTTLEEGTVEALMFIHENYQKIQLLTQIIKISLTCWPNKARTLESQPTDSEALYYCLSNSILPDNKTLGWSN